MTVMQNKYVEAHFAADGRLIHLSIPGGENLISGIFCHCHMSDEEGNGFLVSEDPDRLGQAAGFEVLQVSESQSCVARMVRSGELEIEIRFELLADSPLLQVYTSVRGRPGWKASQIALPRVQFVPGFANAFEDERDCYFDGEEVGDGRELPCWRVFFKEGIASGVLAATRSKLDMSHFQIVQNGFDLRPHVMTAYDTNYVLAHSAIDFSELQEYRSAFEIGPWDETRHEEIHALARLGEPVETGNPPATGLPPGHLKGVVFGALEFADEEAVSKDFDSKKWMIVDLPCCYGGRALMAGPSVEAPDLMCHPELSGLHRVIVGSGNGDGIFARFTGDPLPTIRITGVESGGGAASRTPFYLHLSGPQESREISLGVHDMGGKSVTLSKYPHSYARTVVDYVRFEALSDDEAARWNEVEDKEPCIPLSGFNDIPDIAPFTSQRDPDPMIYKANLWEHARCKFDKVYWRIDGQCSDYPSKFNTMRYISAKVHGVFSPQSKAYGRALKKVDMLKLAVEAAHEYGLKLYGWMRFNNYGGNVQCEFFKQHPELREEWEPGRPANKLCLAHPEVRKHKIDILVEAAGYGLDGLNLGLLRHPPPLLYAPVLVDGFKKQFGKTPPPPRADDHTHISSLPNMTEEYLEWYLYRTGFMTQFGRELRSALNGRGMEHVKIAMWLRPNHCLFDSIDLPLWLEEGLCDEIVVESYNTSDWDEEVYGVRPDWKEMVQAKVPLIRSIFALGLERATDMALSEGYDGLCTYESDWYVLDDRWIDFYRNLRK
ncbi:MAG: hypothetical protein O3B01_10855 [Planctomycetota bacterium]|nr:hypothetical protein [Planctomycetota bacterium]MDA1139070.1 hypothetical protein [Planctomycetota bacterium]